MLLIQTVLLSLALSTSAREISGRRYWGGGWRKGSEGGESSSSSVAAVSNSKVTTTAAAVSSIIAVSSSTGSAATAVSSAATSSTSSLSTLSSTTSKTDSSAATSSTNSSPGNVVVAGIGNSSTGTADQSRGDGSSATLLTANVQAASDSTGSANAEAGQTDSATDPDNFINFCSGKTITNGLQITAGSCNGIVMGDIPSSANMISTIITNPAPGDTIAANTNFTVNIQVTNLNAGSFTNPATTYYAAPQALKNGNIVGHTHITIQSLGNSIITSTPPDAATFAFFKGVNDAGNGEGGLSATVAGGLPAGAYRVCTMTSASNHQPVLMPVAQRGAQDDCTKFTVSDSGAASAGKIKNAASNASSSSSSTTAAAASISSTTVAGAVSNITTGSSSSRDGNRVRYGRFAAKAFVA